MSVTEYLTGHVKRDPATGAVAIRTIFPEDGSLPVVQAWLMATANQGAHHKSTADVAAWDDLYTPPAEPERVAGS